MEHFFTDKAMHDEAVRRMKILGAKPRIISAYDNTGNIMLITLNMTDYHQISEKMMQTIRSIEEAYRVEVYMVIRKFIKGKSYLALLFVSSNEDNWPEERKRLDTHYPFNYLFDADMLNMFPESSILCVDHTGDVPDRIWLKQKSPDSPKRR